jgi:hypothetical protein
MQQIVGDCSNFLISLEVSRQLVNAPRCFCQSLFVYASPLRRSNSCCSCRSSLQAAPRHQDLPRRPRLHPGIRLGVSNTSGDGFQQIFRPPGALVINSVKPSSTDAWRVLHPVVCASGAPATIAGELVAAFGLDVTLLLWSKDLLVIRSSSED